jgi:hypothetical protein
MLRKMISASLICGKDRNDESSVAMMNSPTPPSCDAQAWISASIGRPRLGPPRLLPAPVTEPI